MTCPYKTPDGYFPSMFFCKQFFDCGDCIDNYEMMKDSEGKNKIEESNLLECGETVFECNMCPFRNGCKQRKEV